MRRSVLILTVLMLAIGALPASAQETRGAIEGVVKDSSGGVLPGVTVTATSASGAVQAAVTDAKGAYRFPALQPGTYTVTSTLSGFTPGKAENLQIGLGMLQTVNLTMAPGGRTETVEVTAVTPTIDVKQNSVTSIVTSDVIDLIPKAGVGILDALSGLPGAGLDAKGGGFMVDGAGASENRYIIDGMDASNLQSGALGKDLSINFIDQIQVKSSGYNAEYRAATGGVVSAVTKSGSNSYHGSLNTFVSGRPLRGFQGAIRPQIRLLPTDSTKFEYFTTPRLNETTTTNNDYSAGGPVFKSKLWFFGGYNPAYTKTVRNVIWTTPAAFVGPTCAAAVAAGVVQTRESVQVCPKQTFDAVTDDKSGLYNVTSQLLPTLRFRFNGANQRRTGGLVLPTIDANLGTNTQNATTFNPRATTYTKTFNDNYSAVFDWTVSNSTFINVTTGVLSYGSHTEGGGFYQGIRRTFSASNLDTVKFPDIPDSLRGANGFADHLSNVFTAKNDFKRYNVNADVTKFMNLKGQQHSFKAGAQLERFGNDVNSGQQFPNVALVWDGTRTTLGNLQVRGKYGYYTVGQQYTIGNVRSNNMGFYAQDQWTVSRKLTVNYGLRTDHTNIPSYREENPGIVFGFNEKIAPRLGFAYDLKGDGKWKGYGSWGVFYDIEKLEMPLGSFGAQHWNTYYWTLDDPDWTKISCDGTPNSGCPGTYIEQNDLRHVSNGTGADNLVDPNLKPYKSEEVTFGMDHELGRRMSMGVRFTHKWIDMGIEDVGVQVPGVGEVFYTANPGYGYGEFPLKSTCPECNFPATPKPVRHYDGLQFTFDRRLSGKWQLKSSFLISRTFGSYSGLTSSDENGRNSPGVNRFYDGLSMSFNEKGEAVYGRLPSDRPYVLKIQPVYILPWGTQAGAEIDVLSGQPNSTIVAYKAVPVYVYGRGNLGRSPTLSYTNLNFQQVFKLGKGRSIMAALNIDNLFDQMTELAFTGISGTSGPSSPYRDAMSFIQCTGGTAAANSVCADRVFFAGFNTQAVMAASNAANVNTGRPNALFNHANSFQDRRVARLQVRFNF